MKFEPIGNLVSSVQQYNPDTLGRPWIIYLDIASIDNAAKKVVAPQRIAADLAPSRARQLVHTDDVLVSTVRPNLNAVALVQHKFDGEVASTGFCVLRPKKANLSAEYLFYFTQTAGFVSHLSRIATGASYPAVTDQDIFETPIPLPTLAEQKRIAGLLEHADRLRRTRRYALELSDTFLSAAFLELFGNPVSNSKGWPRAELGDHLEFLTSGSRGWAEYYAEEGEIFLRIQNVGRGQLLLDDLTFVHAPNNAEAKRTQVRPGDVLLSITADLGRSAAIPNHFPVAFMNQHLALLRPRGVNPDFLASLLSSDAARSKWSSLDRQGVKSGLNFDDVRGFKIILPPDSVQSLFASIVSRAGRMQAGQREALRQADHLFQSLLYRAFVR